MEEWFYVKNDLKAREDIKEIIMRPIWSRFGLRKSKVEIDEAVEACRRAFSTVCSFIGTRDLIQEHVAFRIWPLIDSWEMPKESSSNPSEGDLVRLKYTFRFGDQFVELDDDWLKCVENTSNELLGAYSKSEDNALFAAFGSRKKNYIGFLMLLDLCILTIATRHGGRKERVQLLERLLLRLLQASLRRRRKSGRSLPTDRAILNRP
jgi:hypothetical protein